jgi:hypothetical protein
MKETKGQRKMGKAEREGIGWGHERGEKNPLWFFENVFCGRKVETH